MEIVSLLGVLAVFLLVLANGFFVATEFSIVAVRRSRIEQLAAGGSSRAVAAQDLLEHLDTYIAACQFGITLSSLGLGALGEPALAHLIEPVVLLVDADASPAVVHSVAIGIAFSLITALHIVFGELAPKGIALQRAELTSLWVARPMQIFYAVFRWPISWLNAIGNGTLRMFRLEPATGHEMVHSVDELRMLVVGMQRAGVVEESEARIAARAFRFADLTAASMMTPRTEMDAVPVTSTREELLRYAREGQHSRLPVYDKTIDDVLGALHVRDLFRVLDGGEEFDLRQLVRPVLMVPETKAADDLLDEMRAAGRHFAVVIDEYGGTAGVVTIGNLLEGLVGGFTEEEASASDTPEAANAAGVHQIDGLTRLTEVEETLGVRLHDDDHAASETIGGLVMTRLDRIPEVGDEVALDGWTLRVEEKDGMRVSLVKAIRAGGEDAETPVRP